MPMLTTSVIVASLRTPFAKARIRASVAYTPGITSCPSTKTGPPSKLRSAVCRTARPSVSLIGAPANIASRIASQPVASISAISASRVSASKFVLA